MNKAVAHAHAKELESNEEDLLQRLEDSDAPGAKVLARIIRRADSEDAEVVMWAQNWNAHSRST